MTWIELLNVELTQLDWKTVKGEGFEGVDGSWRGRELMCIGGLNPDCSGDENHISGVSQILKILKILNFDRIVIFFCQFPHYPKS